MHFSCYCSHREVSHLPWLDLMTHAARQNLASLCVFQFANAGYLSSGEYVASAFTLNSDLNATFRANDMSAIFLPDVTTLITVEADKWAILCETSPWMAARTKQLIWACLSFLLLSCQLSIIALHFWHARWIWQHSNNFNLWHFQTNLMIRANSNIFPLREWAAETNRLMFLKGSLMRFLVA